MQLNYIIAYRVMRVLTDLPWSPGTVSFYGFGHVFTQEKGLTRADSTGAHR